MKCYYHDCDKMAVKGCYCQEHYELVQSLPGDEGGEDQNVPEENTGQFPW